MTNDIVRAIDVALRTRERREEDEGVVVSIASPEAHIQVGGSQTITALYNSGSRLAVGDRVIIKRGPRSGRWIVLQSYGTDARQNYEDYPTRRFGELAPPAPVESVSVPGGIMWRWNAPAQRAVAFDVQLNDAASETNAQIVLRTRGSTYMLPIDEPRFVRIRSISETFDTSGWSAWVEGTPGNATGGSPVNALLSQLLRITGTHEVPEYHQAVIHGRLEILSGGHIDLNGQLLLLI